MAPDIQPLLREREALQASLEAFKELIMRMDKSNELQGFLKEMQNRSFLQQNQKGNNQ
jgi:hypothetical protein